MKSSERHKIKEDKFAAFVAQGVAWLKHHQNVILITSVVALVIVVGSIWISSSRRSAELAASGLLRDLQNLAAEMEQKPAEERTESLDQLTRLADRMAAEYTGASATPLALIRAGEVLAASGKPEKAVEFFQRAAKLGHGRPGTAFLARRGLAQSLEAAGKTQEAIEQYNLLTLDAASPLTAQANWDIGRCYDALGDHEKAVAYYQKVVDYAGDSDWGRMARSQLAGVTPVDDVSADTEPAEAQPSNATKADTQG